MIPKLFARRDKVVLNKGDMIAWYDDKYALVCKTKIMLQTDEFIFLDLIVFYHDNSRPMRYFRENILYRDSFHIISRA